MERIYLTAILHSYSPPLLPVWTASALYWIMLYFTLINFTCLPLINNTAVFTSKLLPIPKPWFQKKGNSSWIYSLDFKQIKFLWCDWSSSKDLAVSQSEMDFSTYLINLTKIAWTTLHLRLRPVHTQVCPSDSIWMVFQTEFENTSFLIRPLGLRAAHLPATQHISEVCTWQISSFPHAYGFLPQNTASWSTCHRMRQKKKCSPYHQRFADSKRNSSWGYRFQYFHCLCQSCAVQIFLIDKDQAVPR